MEMETLYETNSLGIRHSIMRASQKRENLQT
jgi:hypothetical protein